MNKADKDKYYPKAYEELVHIKKVYACCQCNKEYPDELQFKKHIDLCNRKAELLWMWENGYTINTVKERFDKIPYIPKGLENITKDTVLIYERDGIVKKNVKIAKWSMTGFYLSFEGKENHFNNTFYSLKYLRVED